MESENIRGSVKIGEQTINIEEEFLSITKRVFSSSDGGGFLSAIFSAASAKMNTHSIPFDSIHSIKISEGGWGSSPFLQVISGGEKAANTESEASESPSCVVAHKRDIGVLKALKASIEERIVNSKQAAKGGHPTNSVADEIAKLAALLASGILTQEEFDKKKSQLLS